MTEERKYEIELPDGKKVSRQYAHQLAHPEVYKERKRKYYLKKKAEKQNKVEDSNDSK